MFHRRRNIGREPDVSGSGFPAPITVGEDHRWGYEFFINVPGDLALRFRFRQSAQRMSSEGQAESHEILPKEADNEAGQRHPYEQGNEGAEGSEDAQRTNRFHP